MSIFFFLDQKQTTNRLQTWKQYEAQRYDIIDGLSSENKEVI